MRLTLLLTGFLIAATPLACMAQAQTSGGHYSQQQINDMVATAVQIQLKQDKNDHSTFIYHDHDVKPGKNQYSIIVQTVSHGSIRRITRINGKAVPLSAQKAQVQRFVDSPSLQQKQHQNDVHDTKQVEQLLRMIPKAFLWNFKSETPTEITLSYKPNPDFHPPNKEDRVFAAMAGEMTIDRKQHCIVSFKGKLIHTVNFFFGLIGHMDKGGTFGVERRQLEPGVWEIVSTHTHINGHVLLFKTISQNEDDYDTDFAKAPQNLTLKEAAALAMKQPNWPNTTSAHTQSSSKSSGGAGTSH